jgi:hypothetical protein
MQRDLRFLISKRGEIFATSAVAKAVAGQGGTEGTEGKNFFNRKSAFVGLRRDNETQRAQRHQNGVEDEWNVGL